MKTPFGHTSALRAAAYVRVSSEELVAGHSLDAQRRAIEAACAERGRTIVAWYADEGVSAHTDDTARRPAFHRMVQDAEQHRFDAVICHKLDRFARSVVVALGTFKLLSNLGITFLSLSEAGMDFTSPMGKVLFNLLAAFAEYYRENLGLETKKGKAERRAKGLHNGLVPFGYRSVDGGLAEPEPETVPGAVLAFELAKSGHSLRDGAQALNAAGYRTAGNMRRGVFTKDTVRDMLANRFYLGELPVFEPGSSRRLRGWAPGKHTAIIDPAVFEAVRGAISGRAAAAKTHRSARVYSLSGLLRCAHCGERMRVVRTEPGRVRYHCRSKAQGLGCSGKGSLLDVYEAQLAADLERIVLPDDWKPQIIAAVAAEGTGDTTGDNARQQLQARRDRLRDLYAWGELSAAAFKAECTAIDAELARLTPPEPHMDALDALAEYVESLTAAWADASQAERSALANIIYEV